jgi:hypothetical protein
MSRLMPAGASVGKGVTGRHTGTRRIGPIGCDICAPSEARERVVS